MKAAQPRKRDWRRGDAQSLKRAALPGAPVVSASGAAWFLDFDGTLVELAQAPEEVWIEAEVVEIVAELERAARGAVALISGRSIADIDRHFHPRRLVMAGQHGAERRDSEGRVHRCSEDRRDFDALRESLQSWIARSQGLMLENKGSTLAVHYRNAPDAAGHLGAFMQELVSGTDGRYCLQGGKMVLEIRPAGTDKGAAVLQFMRERPFSDRVPVFVGDDISDESAFAAVMSLGGAAVKVGDGDSIAPWRLKDVAQVHAWIRRIIAPAPSGSGKE